MPTWVGTSAAPIFGTTSAIPTWPTGYTPTAGDLAVLVVSSRHATATTVPSTPAGWTQQVTLSGGGGTFGTDAGPSRITLYTRPLVGGETLAAVTQATGNTSTMGASITILRPTAAGATYSVAATTGADTTSGTGFSAACSANPGFATGDAVVLGFCLPSDTPTMSAEAMTATGATFATTTERLSQGTTQGNDHRHVVATSAVASGTATAAPTVTGTLSVAATGVVGVLRVREVPVTTYTKAGTGASGRVGSGTKVVTQPAPLVETLVDDFTGAALDARWVPYGGVALTGSGQLELTPPAPGTVDYAQVRSAVPYALRGSRVYVDMTRPTGVAGAGSYETLFRVDAGSQRFAEWMLYGDGTSIMARRWTAGVDTAIVSGTWDPVAMRYLRIAEAAGVATFATAPDAVTWTAFATVDLTALWGDGWQDAVAVVLLAGHWNTETLTAPTALFEGVNVAAATVRVKAGAGAAAATGAGAKVRTTPAGYTKTGAGSAGAAASGAKTVTAAQVRTKTGSGAAVAAAGGAKTVTAAAVRVKAGTAATGGAAAGAETVAPPAVRVKTGAAVSAAVAAGVKTVAPPAVQVKAGAGASGAAGAGGKQVQAAAAAPVAAIDVLVVTVTYSPPAYATSVKAGAGAAGPAATGARVVVSTAVYVKAGAGATVGAGAGAKVVYAAQVQVKTGSAAAAAAAAGVRVRTSAAVHTKTGTTAAAGVGGGTRLVVTGWRYAGTAASLSGPWVNTPNAVGPTEGDTATWTATGAGSAVLELAGFGLEQVVPDGAVIESLALRVRTAVSDAAVTSLTAQCYVGAVPVGGPQPLVRDPASHEDVVTVSGVAYADLADLRVRISAGRA